MPRVVAAPSVKAGKLPRTFGAMTSPRRSLPVQPTSTIPPKERFGPPPPMTPTVGT